MTKTYRLLGVTAGILVFSLTGCLNPITHTPPSGTSAGVQEIPDGDQPFTLTLAISGKDGAGSTDRSITGLNHTTIKLSGTGIRNYMQLIVTDSSGDIVSYSESRHEPSVSNMGTLTTKPLDIDDEYNFLFLMGHWERDYTAPSNGAYKPYYSLQDVGASPLTLLAAGYLPGIEIEPGINTITIIIYPFTIDMKFEAVSDPSAIVEPELINGKPQLSLPWIKSNTEYLFTDFSP